MPYLPKNRYQGNLFTDGGEYQIASTGREYKGYYYKTYDGQYYTGKNPQVNPSVKLIPHTTQGYTGKSYGGFFNKDSARYTFIRKDTKTNGIVFNDELPIPRNPIPTLADYELGEFQRYFVAKRNEPLYIEILKRDFDDFSRNKSSYKYTLYRPFSLSWTITGDPQQVYDVNRNLTLLQESNLKLSNFSQYIKNYTKFYSLYTKGGEYVYKDGTPYKGLYHIMPDGTVMTGKTHTTIANNSNTLYPVNQTPLSSQVGNY